MIQVTFTKREMLYAIADQINTLKQDYFTFCMNMAIAMDGKTDEEDITMDVTVDLLVLIHAGVSNYFHGMAKNINPSMLVKVQNQLYPLANLAAVQAGLESPNEYSQALILINKKNISDASAIEGKVCATKNALGIL